MPTPAEIAAAAAPEVVDKVPAGAVPAGKKYPSPTSYKNHEWAKGINDLLNKADPAPPNSFLGSPASKLWIGESAMATAEAWGLNADAKAVPIHPGFLLLFGVVAYVLVLVVHYKLAKPSTTRTSTPAPAPKGDEETAGLA